MRIFITGAAGFLGHHLAVRMLQQGHEVAGNDNFMGGDITNIASDVLFNYVDCCDFARMRTAIEGSDILYHCAATAHEGLSVFSPSFITRNIYEASVTTFSAAIAAGVKRIIHCSSMARYGNLPHPFVETQTPQPVDPYGIAKLATERTLEVLGNVHGVEWNIAIPHNIVGPYQKYDDPYRNVMSIMLNRNLKGLPAVIYGDGRQTRCFSYVDDCIGCLERLGLSRITKMTVNIGPDEEPVSINTLAKLCAEETGFVGEPIYYAPGRAQEVKHAVCSSNLARQLLGYKTRTTLREAIKHTADHIRRNGTKEFNYALPVEIVNELTPKTWTERWF